MGANNNNPNAAAGLHCREVVVTSTFQFDFDGMQEEAREIMSTGFYDFWKRMSCLAACFCPCCISGMHACQAYGHHNPFTWLVCTIINPICCGWQRGLIQDYIGVPNDGCVYNTWMHIPCCICARAQESRAMQLMSARQRLKSKYGNKIGSVITHHVVMEE